jgi:hypothetical protein
MPVGYHRNVLAASPTGSHAPFDPRAARRPGGSGLAETSLTRSRRVRRSCLDSPQRAISPCVCVEKDPAKGRLRCRSRSDDRVETEAATLGCSAKMRISTRRKKCARPLARCAVAVADLDLEELQAIDPPRG